MSKPVVLLFLVLFNFSYGVIYKLSDEEYRVMPPILRLDPYEVCMQRPGAVYCTAYMNFVSDVPSALLTQMQEYSEHTSTHFNHTRVVYGTCMTETCAPFYNATEETVDLKESLEACRNETLYEEYKLRVLVEDDVSCVGGKHDKIQIGPAHIVVAAICIALVILNLIGSLYDVFSKEEDKNGPASQLFLCFSVPRNWRKLVAVPGERDPRQKSFRGFYGIRAILMTLVISTHSMIPSMLLNEETKFLEENLLKDNGDFFQMYEDTWLHIILNGTLIMQIFLQLSALMLVYNGLVISEKHQLSWKMLPLGILKRWLRLTPAYGLVLGVTATWLQYIGTGPLWDKLVTIEAKDCRKNWWTHLLYINNYFDNSHCMPQAWYLAADTQLYVLGVIIFVYCKSPWSRKVVLSILFLIGLVLPGLHTYFQDLDGTLIVSPTAAAGFFVSDPTFNNVYKRGHTNISCYALGLAFGYLVYYLQDTNFDISKYKRWRLVYWTLFPFGCCLVLLCKLGYAEGPRLPALYRVAVACFMKPLFGLIYLLLALGMIFKIENLYRGVLEWRGWTCLGRVSYSAYLLHFAFIRTMAGLRTHAINGTYSRMFEIVLFSLVATYTAAYIFYITVETPLGELAKAFLDPKNPEQTAGDNVEKNECHSKL